MFLTDAVFVNNEVKKSSHGVQAMYGALMMDPDGAFSCSHLCCWDILLLGYTSPIINCSGK